MRKVKNSLVVIVLLTIGMITLTGCESSEQRIAQLEALIATTQQASAAFDGQIILIKNSMPQLKAALVDGNIPPEIRQEAAQALATAETKLKTFEEAKAKGDAAIANWKNTIAQVKADANSLGWGNEVQIIGEGVKETSGFLPQPYAGYAYALGWILAIVGGAFSKKKSIDEKKAQEEKAKTQAKYQAHKQGVEKTMKEVSHATNAEVKMVETQLYNNIGYAREALGVS